MDRSRKGSGQVKEQGSGKVGRGVFGRESIWFQPTLESEFCGSQNHLRSIQWEGIVQTPSRPDDGQWGRRHPAEGHKERQWRQGWRQQRGSVRRQWQEASPSESGQTTLRASAMIVAVAMPDSKMIARA